MNEIKIKTIMEIEGYTSLKEGLFLYSLANNMKKYATIVEIGSWKGRSTVWLASGLKNGAGEGRVVAVDHGIGDSHTGPQQTTEVFSENIRKAAVEGIVTTIFKKSVEAIAGWSGDIDLLFIDGAHDYQNVKMDFAWEKYLTNGGWLVMHDVINPGEGPARMFIEGVLSSNGFTNFGTVDSIMFAQKKSQPNQYSSRRFFLRTFLRFSLFLTNVYKRLPRRGLRKKIVRILMKDFLRSLIATVANFQLETFIQLNARFNTEGL